MFFFNLTYKKSISEVEKYLNEHNQYLDQFYKNGNFIFSGRKVPRTGGVILCKAKDIQAAEAIYHNDPFYKNGIAEYNVTEFQPTKANTEFKKIISNN